MLVANRDRMSPSAGVAPRALARVPAPVPRGGGTLPGAAHVPHGDRLAGQLARAVTGRAPATRSGGPLLQRAIIAIDGSTDSDVAKAITRNCLANLLTRPQRGASDGPTSIDLIAPPPLAPKESLYILGHGNTDAIGDSSPEALGAQILAWYGTTAYRGKVKLVACSSGIKPDAMTSSYAERLNNYLAANHTPTFRPKSVDGVLGIAWVHDDSSRIVAIDDPKYDEHEKNNPGSVEDAFGKKNRKQRGTALETLFGVPDAPSSSVHTGVTAKIRYYTGLPKAPQPGFSLGRFLRRLIPCIP
jgi:hypothetical protein